MGDLTLLDGCGEPVRLGSNRPLDPSKEYLLCGETEALIVARDALGERVCRGVAQTGVLRLCFGNYECDADLPGLGRIRVRSPKLEPGAFNQMLHDVMAVASNLPFAAGTPTALPYDRSIAWCPDVLYHAFVYLRYILSDEAPAADQLLPALRHVLREPHRRFERESVAVPPAQVRCMHPGALARVLQTRRFEPVGADVAARAPLATALRGLGCGDGAAGYLPERVHEARVRSTSDTPENRFVKAFLRMAQGILDRAPKELEGKGFHTRVVRDCERLRKVLLPIIRHTFWNEVERMVHFPASSTVLQRRRGYREVLRHFVRLRLTAEALLGDALDRVLEMKDVALLYELWAFFRVAAALQELLGSPAQAGGPTVRSAQVDVPYGLCIWWPDGTRLLYNATFGPKDGGDQRSYSLPLRPDVVLWLTSGPNAGLHLFDAKYRLEQVVVDSLLAGKASLDAIEQEEDGERHGTFNRADLYKMHAYKDAIPAARSVWVLYPGDKFAFFHHDYVAHMPAQLPPRLEGVGAVPLVPGDPTILRDLLERILAH